MRPVAVESTHNLFLQPVGLRRVLRLHHLLGEPPEFFRSELATFPDVTGEFDDLVLFVSRQPFYLFNNFNRSHGSSVRSPMLGRKRGTAF